MACSHGNCSNACCLSHSLGPSCADMSQAMHINRFPRVNPWFRCCKGLPKDAQLDFKVVRAQGRVCVFLCRPVPVHQADRVEALAWRASQSTTGRCPKGLLNTACVGAEGTLEISPLPIA
eukprot:721817-Amphidinium_carterae.1